MKIDFPYPIGYTQPWRIEQSKEYSQWMRRLNDVDARTHITRRIQRIADNGRLLGDWKSISNGLIELRFHEAPGYRVYASVQQQQLLLVLAGGNKTSQNRDVIEAKWILEQWKKAQQ